VGSGVFVSVGGDGVMYVSFVEASGKQVRRD
jgi:hypothetical protein